MAYGRLRNVLTVANFNMHAGIDGWGRPYDYLAACRALQADILVLEEVWTADAEHERGGQSAAIADALGYQRVHCTLAEGYKIRPQAEATESWMARPAFAEANKALYFDAVRPIPPSTLALPRLQEAERGSWGIAVLVRQGLTIADRRTLHLPTLSRDRVRRAALVVDLAADGVDLSIVGTHMSHLHMGSSRHYRQLRHEFDQGQARPTAVLAGDMNLWGPPVRYFLRGWHRAVKGASWPTWHPHSQIDHILVRGAIGIVSGEVMPDAGSDHRPVRAVLRLGEA